MLFEFEAVKNIVIGPALTVYPPPPVPVPVVNAPVAAPMPICLAAPPPPGMILPVMFGYTLMQTNVCRAEGCKEASVTYSAEQREASKVTPGNLVVSP